MWFDLQVLLHRALAEVVALTWVVDSMQWPLPTRLHRRHRREIVYRGAVLVLGNCASEKER
jgi:hypothetical protein